MRPIYFGVGALQYRKHCWCGELVLGELFFCYRTRYGGVVGLRYGEFWKLFVSFK